MKKATVITTLGLITALAGLILPGSTSTSSYYLDTSRLELQASPTTGIASGVIKVTSNSERPIRLKVIPKLWELSPQGVLTYINPPTNRYNLLDNISINPQEFELLPGRSRLVRFLAKTPSKVDNMEYPFQLYFEPVSLLVPSAAQQNTGVSNILDVIPVFTTTIYVYQGKPMPDVIAKDFTCAFLPQTKKFSIAFNMENRGSKHARLFGNVLISRKETPKENQPPLDVLHLHNSSLLIVFPGKERVVEELKEPEVIQNLEAGQYEMELQLVDERKEQNAVRATCNFEVGSV